MWSVANTPMSLDPLGHAGMVVNADMDTRDVKPSGVDMCKQGALLVWGAAPPMAKGAASVESAGGAQKAAAA